MTQHTNSRRPNRRRRTLGMTLIEIMVVVTILGLIAAAVGIAVVPALDSARRDTARQDISAIQNGLKLYYTKKGKYPDTASGLKVLLDEQILEKITDPWGNEYVYLNEGGRPVITSYAADGAPGGEGNAADISSKDAAAPK
ncbi:MAG: type II secretion system protein GspG [Myxococcaceae bacterium]|nr:type II secretion system protein GspG [Myxococcaceae bacterium]MCI0673558.1 type II secretion system protein GspG [Myxococcaceae bacterium]